MLKIQKTLAILIGTLVLAVTISGCQSVSATTDIANEAALDATESVETITRYLDATADLFSTRDLEDSYDENQAVIINLKDDETNTDDDKVSIVENKVTISDEGLYILRGGLSNGQIIIDAEKTDKIQLVLDGVEIRNASSSPIYVKQADKVFITLAKATTSSLFVDGEFVSIDDNNLDAALFSKEDLTINGRGSLNIVNEYGNGITSKDDLVLTDGNIDIDVSGHGLEGKNSIRIAAGAFVIKAQKDGIQSVNDDDLSLGLIYVVGGQLTIDAGDDGIRAGNTIEIYDGSIQITHSYEGIEGRSIDIYGGEISINSIDDGLNASSKSAQTSESITPDTDIYISISGGRIDIDSNNDGIDANGYFYVSGGETYISATINERNGGIDYDRAASITGGVIVAAGRSHMAQNFGDDSTQGSILLDTINLKDGVILLTDSEGTELLRYSPEKQYDSVLISTPDITSGSTYSITMGDEVQRIEMSSLIHGTGNNFGPGPGEMREGNRRLSGEQNQLPPTMILNETQLRTILEDYVASNVLTNEEADVLVNYMMEYEPSADGLPIDPLAGAVEEGIITKAQAAAIELLPMPGVNDRGRPPLG